jgi:hypothetical protein
MQTDFLADSDRPRVALLLVLVPPRPTPAAINQSGRSGDTTPPSQLVPLRRISPSGVIGVVGTTFGGRPPQRYDSPGGSVRPEIGRTEERSRIAYRALQKALPILPILQCGKIHHKWGSSLEKPVFVSRCGRVTSETTFGIFWTIASAERLMWTERGGFRQTPLMRIFFGGGENPRALAFSSSYNPSGEDDPQKNLGAIRNFRS